MDIWSDTKVQSTLTIVARCWRRLLLIACLLLTALPASADDLLADLKAERRKYTGTLSPADVAALLNAAVRKHHDEGWRLFKKTSGHRCPLSPSVDISCDIVIHVPSLQWFDVLKDTENSATVVDALQGQRAERTPDDWVEAIGPAEDPRPVSTPGDPPAAHDSTAIAALATRVHAVEGLLAGMSAAVIGTQATLASTVEESRAQRAVLDNLLEQMAALSARIDALGARPIPASCRASVLGIGIACRLE